MDEDDNDLCYSGDKVYRDQFVVTLTRGRDGFSWELAYSGVKISGGVERTETRALTMAQANRSAWTHLELIDIQIAAGQA